MESPTTTGYVSGHFGGRSPPWVQSPPPIGAGVRCVLWGGDRPQAGLDFDRHVAVLTTILRLVSQRPQQQMQLQDVTLCNRSEDGGDGCAARSRSLIVGSGDGGDRGRAARFIYGLA